MQSKGSIQCIIIQAIARIIERIPKLINLEMRTIQIAVQVEKYINERSRNKEKRKRITLMKRAKKRTKSSNIYPLKFSEKSEEMSGWSDSIAGEALVWLAWCQSVFNPQHSDGVLALLGKVLERRGGVFLGCQHPK